jgi:hypothetical protein
MNNVRQHASVGLKNVRSANATQLRRKSVAVALVLSGALLAGCQRKEEKEWSTSESPLTNNTYHPSYGYYHAPYHGWFPFPYNSFAANRGYFHGGRYTSEPNNSGITASKPVGSSPYVSRGGFGRSSSGIS